jgi:cysteinyl-tRNA synthetase
MRLYNTLSGGTEIFTPDDDIVKIYVCGVTPYSASHVGHAMRAVVFDVIRRYLEFSGHSVKHVENFTDIDDKMIDRAAENGTTTIELAEGNIQTYLREMDALNIKRAHVYPRATQEIPKILEIIVGLIDNGLAYTADGDVYFRVRAHEGYGALGKRSLDDMIAGARIAVDETKKEDPMDFALWKGHKPGEPSWSSPWGPGRPGWHIECSAMAMGYLGDTLDIHGGGQDLVFPHHENEMAQSEGFTGQKLAKFWVHNGLMRLGDARMSKSDGNLVTVADALELHSSDALRLFFLSSHYRGPLTYTEEAVDAQERGLERLRNAADLPALPDSTDLLDPAIHEKNFVDAMDDDLNTPRAIAALFDMSRDINRAREAGRATSVAQEKLRELAGVLGLTLTLPAQEDSAYVGPLLELLIETRSELRSAKLFEQADALRDRLDALGYSLEDTSAGTEWRRKGP